RVMHLLYAGLTRLDDHLLPRPDLAEQWHVSPDGLQVTFTLRPNLRWSDGMPLTAEDVRFTWDALRSWEVRLGLQADLHDYVAAVTAPVSDTVVFILNRRLAGLLADASYPILPRHIWGGLSPQALQEADLLSIPVGSGPFLLKERWPGEALVLERNPYYYGPSPFLDQVALLVAPDPQVTEGALRQGDLHLAQVPPEVYRALQESPAQRPLVLARYPAPQYTFVAFNLRDGRPFADPALRRAWALAVDQEAVVRQATGGEGIPLRSPILPPNWAYVEPPPRRSDPEEARARLAGAGWSDSDGDGIVEKDGRPLVVRLYVRADAPERLEACRLMAEQVRAVGIAVEVVPADFQSVIAAKLRPPYDFDLLCMQWRNLGPDPDLFYLFHSSQVWQEEGDSRENLYNLVGYRSEEADRLLLAGRDTYDPEKRREVYRELQEVLDRDLPYYLLWGDPLYLVADARLTSADGPIFWETPNFFWNIERWYFRPE
ncbi:MAG: peptide ABC transporter substrate-binding protein, partial [Chloroflexia bacterium]